MSATALCWIEDTADCRSSSCDRRQEPSPESAESDRQHGNLLAHVVVQVACDSRPLFGVLCRNERPGEVLDLLIAGPEAWPRCREWLARRPLAP